ncbi:MAG: thermonuclease family protein [Gemmatimonadota bacterium]|nr:thermonuclease family protein [Gemmatimonadota bacterium]
MHLVTRTPKRGVLAALLLWAAPAGCLSAQPADTLCIVTSVHDGDTLRCTNGMRVRLTGIDAPELDQQPFGVVSRDGLRRLVSRGDTVRLELDVQPTDRYGRTLAYVWAGDTLVNDAMLAAGLAQLLTYPPNVRYVERFTATQRAAREAKRGLWADDGLSCAPVEHRRGRC